MRKEMEDANRIEEKLGNESGGDQGTSEGNKSEYVSL